MTSRRSQNRTPRTAVAHQRGQVPVLGRFFPAPAAAKVPEIIALFWVVKLLTTAGGEALSDYLKNYGNLGGGGVEVVLFLSALGFQFATRRYRAFAYWYLAYAIATAGCGFADFLHLDVHIPYAGTSVLWAVILAGVFAAWYRSEGTLSIHSIVSQRREVFYWATVFATFALGTALGDFTAFTLHMGYLPSALLFLGIILLPAIAWRGFRVNSIVTFWMAYIVTRPLGASIADWISKPTQTTGLGVGDAPTALLFALITVALVAYLTLVRPDIQLESAVPAGDARYPQPPVPSGRATSRRRASDEPGTALESRS